MLEEEEEEKEEIKQEIKEEGKSEPSLDQQRDSGDKEERLQFRRGGKRGRKNKRGRGRRGSEGLASLKLLCNTRRKEKGGEGKGIKRKFCGLEGEEDKEEEEEGEGDKAQNMYINFNTDGRDYSGRGEVRSHKRKRKVIWKLRGCVA